MGITWHSRFRKKIKSTATSSTATRYLVNQIYRNLCLTRSVYCFLFTSRLASVIDARQMFSAANVYHVTAHAIIIILR